MGNKVFDPEKLIFALDIGTRTIVGLVGYSENGKIRILHVETAEHPARNMLDGQIHNIEGVAETALTVKKKLEKKLQVKLQRVSVAAAGRALTTLSVEVRRELDPQQRITPEAVLELEMEGVKKAQEQLSADTAGKGEKALYCIGYSVVHYYLDGHQISSLISQRGRSMGAVLLVTFLPHAVIDSLLTVIERIGLSLHSLTLEPIAAINALVPPEYRMLNLALVDIGAGTSDIAITRQGTITAYAMVPLAGDEITEAIADHFLLAFNEAEKLKLQLGSGEEKFAFKDIIGNTVNTTREEIAALIEPVVDQLVGKITEQILHFNQSPPRALFCIGGASQTPLLRDKFAKKLNLPLERVAVRDYKALNRFVYSGKKLKGPECVTPMGIALSALNERFLGFAHVTVNGKVVRLLESGPVKVGRMLIIAGFNPGSLISLGSRSKRITINGRVKLFPGKPGQNASISINKKPATLEDLVYPDDQIEVIPATPGQPATVMIKDIYDPEDYYVYCRGEKKYLRPAITLNGEPAADDQVLNDGDSVQIKGAGTLKDLVQNLGLKQLPPTILINDKPADLSCTVNPGDRIDWLETAEEI